jgi:endonuclease-8
MPEGDTLHRTAQALRDVLLGREVTAARGRPDGVSLERVVGSRIDRVEAVGKHLLVGFGSGATLHTHLRMHGSWHRYRPGEAWRRSPARAVAVIEVPGAVAVCFDAPTVELIDTRALALHPTLRALGPDLSMSDADAGEVVRRLRAPERAEMAVGDALLDQTAGAGLGNVYRSEVCFIERIDPMAPVRELTDAELARLVATGSRLLRANLEGGARVTMPDALGGEPGARGPRRRGEQLWVYGRAGRPCRRCRTSIRTRRSGDLARSVYWCPTCQPSQREAASILAPGR